MPMKHKQVLWSSFCGGLSTSNRVLVSMNKQRTSHTLHVAKADQP